MNQTGDMQATVNLLAFIASINYLNIIHVASNYQLPLKWSGYVWVYALANIQAWMLGHDASMLALM